MKTRLSDRKNLFSFFSHSYQNLKKQLKYLQILRTLGRLGNRTRTQSTAVLFILRQLNYPHMEFNNITIYSMIVVNSIFLLTT